eukprot:TRINITY_DN16689_c0_g1_i2.p2 TRINITY_DN16689_c0_g1~~TRINITY_DN16689_c0_g1_i2.p2  ORF type:complete len:168 (+),score=24.09 TRINITY_DN16689_c0_g1_i2:570-1073(+)
MLSWKRVRYLGETAQTRRGVVAEMFFDIMRQFKVITFDDIPNCTEVRCMTSEECQQAVVGFAFEAVGWVFILAGMYTLLSVIVRLVKYVLAQASFKDKINAMLDLHDIHARREASVSSCESGLSTSASPGGNHAPSDSEASSPASTDAFLCDGSGQHSPSCRRPFIL